MMYFLFPHWVSATYLRLRQCDPGDIHKHYSYTVMGAVESFSLFRVEDKLYDKSMPAAEFEALGYSAGQYDAAQQEARTYDYNNKNVMGGQPAPGADFDGGPSAGEFDAAQRQIGAYDAMGLTAAAYESYYAMISKEAPKSNVMWMKYEYNSIHKLSRVRNANGLVLADYQYNDNGQCISTSYPHNNTLVSYSLNKAGLPTELQVTVAGRKIALWQCDYSLDGNRIWEVDALEDNSITAGSYDALQLTAADYDAKKIDAIDYDTSAQLRLRDAGAASTMVEYKYDRLGRLVLDARPGWSTAAYEYDRFNNRSKMTVTGGEKYVTVYTYDKNNRLMLESKTQDGIVYDTAYTYDGDGNETRREMKRNGTVKSSRVRVYASTGKMV